MDKLSLQGTHQTNANIEAMAALFPHCITEAGSAQPAIDFDLLRQELSEYLVEGASERYQLNWPGKRQAVLAANTPTDKTLRPVRDDSVRFDTTENLFIEGDNLDALKLLQETYLSKVKMIYIDPPYNTGKDFIYNDTFAHVNREEYLLEIGAMNEEGHIINHELYKENSKDSGQYHSRWLSMMYPRLKLARNLLREDGVMFISIDDNEQANLKRMCDEIFGGNNFIANLVWNKQHSQQQGLFTNYHEHILVFAKKLESVHAITCGEGIIEAGAIKKISKSNPASDFYFPAGVKFDAPDGTEFDGIFGDSEKVEVVSGNFVCKDGKTSEPITLKAGWTQKSQMISWFSGKETFDTRGQRIIEFYFNSSGKLKCRKERKALTPPTILREYGMGSSSSSALINLMRANVFERPKPTEMIKDFVKWFVGNEEIIMDFFAGSGTTAHAVMQLNAEDGGKRRFIMVQLPESTFELNDGREVPRGGTAGDAYAAGYKTIADISKARIRRAGERIREAHQQALANQATSSEPDLFDGAPVDAAHTAHADIDTGFRVLSIDTTNMLDIYQAPDAMQQATLMQQVANIKPDRSAEDLLFQVLLYWGMDLGLPIWQTQEEGCTVFWVAEQPPAGDDAPNAPPMLAACLVRDGSISEALAYAIAAHKPHRLVFCDAGFPNDSVKINVEQILAGKSPDTEIKTI